MTTIGFNFTSSDIYFVVVEGTLNAPNFVSKNKISLPANHSVSEQVDWFENELTAILNNVNPDKVSYRLTINNVTNNYVHSVYYAQGILNLLCHRRQIDICHTSPASVKPNKFNQPNGTNLETYIDNTLGIHPPHWNKNMRNSALVAILHL
tara:strand:+ start:75 stop:527 length:453 start_codon:yes stop_codon:yes gene_type:complete